MKDSNFVFVYTIYDDDIGGNVNKEEFNNLDDLICNVKRDIYSYSNDLPEGVEPTFLEEHDEVFWSEDLILNTLEEFLFYGGLREWVCWFPGHHRKMIVSMEFHE